MEDVCCVVRDRGGMGRPRGLALCFGVGPQLLFLEILTNPRSVKRIYALYKVRFLMALVQWWSGVSSFLAASLPRASRCINSRRSWARPPGSWFGFNAARVERSVFFSSRPREVVAITMYVTPVRPCLILHLSSPINQTLGEGVPSGPSSETAEQGKQ